MLVLSRKVGEKILLDNGIEIIVTEIGQGKCRIGIVAPKTTRILRQELAMQGQADCRDDRKPADRRES